MSDALHARLVAAVHARDGFARKLLYWAQQTSLTLQDPRFLGRQIPGWHDWPDVEIALQALLRDTEAHLDILRCHTPGPIQFAEATPFRVCDSCRGAWPCTDINRLAGIYPEGDET